MHHYETSQCLLGGREEMREGYKQGWASTVFTPDTQPVIEELQKQIVDLKCHLNWALINMQPLRYEEQKQRKAEIEKLIQP